MKLNDRAARSKAYQRNRGNIYRDIVLSNWTTDNKKQTNMNIKKISIKDTKKVGPRWELNKDIMKVKKEFIEKAEDEKNEKHYKQSNQITSEGPEVRQSKMSGPKRIIETAVEGDTSKMLLPECDDWTEHLQ